MIKGGQKTQEVEFACTLSSSRQPSEKLRHVTSNTRKGWLVKNGNRNGRKRLPPMVKPGTMVVVQECIPHTDGHAMPGESPIRVKAGGDTPLGRELAKRPRVTELVNFHHRRARSYKILEIPETP
jgi:hypothetical protein